MPPPGGAGGAAAQILWALGWAPGTRRTLIVKIDYKSKHIFPQSVWPHWRGSSGKGYGALVDRHGIRRDSGSCDVLMWISTTQARTK